jgi:hypothetical protein
MLVRWLGNGSEQIGHVEIIHGYQYASALDTVRVWLCVTVGPQHLCQLYNITHCVLLQLLLKISQPDLQE